MCIRDRFMCTVHVCISFPFGGVILTTKIRQRRLQTRVPEISVCFWHKHEYTQTNMLALAFFLVEGGNARAERYRPGGSALLSPGYWSCREKTEIKTTSINTAVVSRANSVMGPSKWQVPGKFEVYLHIKYVQTAVVAINAVCIHVHTYSSFWDNLSMNFGTESNLQNAGQLDRYRLVQAYSPKFLQSPMSTPFLRDKKPWIFADVFNVPLPSLLRFFFLR